MNSNLLHDIHNSNGFWVDWSLPLQLIWFESLCKLIVQFDCDWPTCACGCHPNETDVLAYLILSHSIMYGYAIYSTHMLVTWIGIEGLMRSNVNIIEVNLRTQNSAKKYIAQTYTHQPTPTEELCVSECVLVCRSGTLTKQILACFVGKANRNANLSLESAACVCAFSHKFHTHSHIVQTIWWCVYCKWFGISFLLLFVRQGWLRSGEGDLHSRRSFTNKHTTIYLCVYVVI